MDAYDDFLGIGETVVLGSHTFEAQAIKDFAGKFDPQRFHVDEKDAENSLFGRLCASGWHTVSTWIKYHIAYHDGLSGRPWSGNGPAPKVGPSPGFKKLRWLKPVYAGETITFTRKALSHRPLASRPGWRLLITEGCAYDSTGDKVLQFENAVFIEN